MRREAAILLLCLASGGIDALSFLALGVFTSAMTGNTALLGIALGESSLADASRAALAFGAFATGVALTAIAPRARPRRWLAAEAALLAGFAILWPLQVHAIHPAKALAPASLPGLIVLAGVAMGVQSATARRLGAAGVNTVVFTTTMTEAVGALTAAALGHAPRRIEPRTWRQIFAFIAYLAGAGGLAALGLRIVALAPVPALVAVALAALLDWQPVAGS